MKKTVLLKMAFLLCALVGSGMTWAQTTITFDFEADGAHRSSGNNSYTSNSYSQNNVTISMSYFDAISNNGISGSYLARGRVAKKTTNSPTLIIGPISITNKTITSIAFKTKGSTDITEAFLTKVDDGDYSSQLSFTCPASTDTKTLNNLSITGTNLYLKWTGSVSSANNSSNRDFDLDDIIITYIEASGDPSSNVAFTNSSCSLDLKQASSFTQTATTADGYAGTSGASVTYSMTTNTADATINSTTGEVTPTQTGSVTIKATAAAIDGKFAASTATYTLTVTDTRADSELAFANASVTKTWGESFTGQALTNPHSLSVTWSSTDEAVATVNSSGVVTMLKAGTTTIKAAFDGDATYKKAIASYTLTINKAAAGLSYTTTSFNIKLNDDSFVAPTLNNPNGLTVTFSSNNTEVALVGENDGILVYEKSVVGTAKITASFAGDDRYYPGSANYTINIVDPTVKGCVFNPFTVAEVINGTATGSGVYFTGYIVGNYNSTAPVNPATADSNFALADAYDETSGSKTIPVELKNNTTWRTNWGPQSNNVIGYKVIIKGNKDTYFSVNGIKSVSEITAVSVPVTPGYNKITYVTPYKMDFSEVSGLKAYVATAANGSGVTMTKVEAAVPENTPLLLIGTKDVTYNVPVAASATAPATNYLVKGDGTTDMSGVDGYNYILFSDGLFYKVNSGTIATTKAYLHLENDPTAGGARGLDIVIDDDVTAIETVKTQKVDDQFYNLAGQRVANPTKGLYIVNGKKVVIK